MIVKKVVNQRNSKKKQKKISFFDENLTVGSLKRKGLKDFVPEGLNKIEKKVKVTTNKWNGILFFFIKTKNKFSLL